MTASEVRVLEIVKKAGTSSGTQVIKELRGIVEECEVREAIQNLINSGILGLTTYWSLKKVK